MGDGEHVTVADSGHRDDDVPIRIDFELVGKTRHPSPGQMWLLLEDLDGKSEHADAGAVDEQRDQIRTLLQECPHRETDGRIHFVFFAHVRPILPDTDDCVALKPRDAADQSYEKVHPAQHQASDERIRSDADAVALVDQGHRAQSKGRHHDAQVQTLDDQSLFPAEILQRT